ncbi:MAG: glycosyltransferase family 2 protein [Candidatus Pacearchaeota archaeon]
MMKIKQVETNKNGKVAIITVTWNGIHHLKKLLPTIETQTYKNHILIIVDNGSSDGTIDYIKKYYPEARIIANTKNEGFARAYNIGIKSVLDDEDIQYIAIINNDMRLDNEWLSSMIQSFKEYENVGAVGSKLLFFNPFINLKIKTSTFNPKKDYGSTDDRNLGLKMWNIPTINKNEYSKRIWREGFYSPEKFGEEEYRWTQEEAELEVPIEIVTNTKAANVTELHLELEGYKVNQDVIITIGNVFKHNVTIGKERKLITINLDESAIGSAYHIVQNAGSVLTASFAGADRGAGEIDTGQYDNIEEAELLCGGSMIFPVKVLREVGLFDEFFFAYYEDTDLAMRIKRMGYRLIYNPKSIVWHIHAGSSKEWSPFFIYITERNWIAFTIKHGSLKNILYAYSHAWVMLYRYLLSSLKGSKEARNRLFISFKSISIVTVYTPVLFIKRMLNK